MNSVVIQQIKVEQTTKISCNKNSISQKSKFNRQEKNNIFLSEEDKYISSVKKTQKASKLFGAILGSGVVATVALNAEKAIDVFDIKKNKQLLTNLKSLSSKVKKIRNPQTAMFVGVSAFAGAVLGSSALSSLAVGSQSTCSTIKNSFKPSTTKLENQNIKRTVGSAFIGTVLSFGTGIVGSALWGLVMVGITTISDVNKKIALKNSCTIK